MLSLNISLPRLRSAPRCRRGRLASFVRHSVKEDPIRYVSLILLSVCTLPSALGCRGVTTNVYSHPYLHINGRAQKDDKNLWAFLDIEDKDSSAIWEAKFKDVTPEIIKIEKQRDYTRIKWLVSKEHVTFFGTHGYDIILNNGKKSYGIHVTLQPDYALGIRFLLGLVSGA